ncbi:MAG: 50S ribosomal protein L4 [Patescibacteria group bacterium]|nr:50S ribosomal protein L4 [Patescibacteria group bacterium]
MAKVNLYKKDGSQSGSVDLPDALFAVEIKPALVHEVIVAQDTNSRVRLAQTKDKSEVRGGGKKPWRQKGTGRARHGSRRSPIWVGGGITFGPTAGRVFAKKINKKARKLAMAMVLTDKLAENWFIAVEDLELPEAKTKFLSEVRAKLPGKDSSALIITTADETTVVKAASNLEKTDTIGAGSLNVRDLVKSQYVIASQAAIEKMKEIYL